MPPLMSRVTPVIQSDWSDARKSTACATSSGSPSLLTALPTFHFSKTAGPTCLVSSVRMGPGATQLT